MTGQSDHLLHRPIPMFDRNCRCAECRDVISEPDCPACGEPYKPGQECQQQPWEAFRDYLPLYCKGDRMIAAPIVEILRWNAAFGPENNTSERAAKNIDDLCSCMEELSRSADTAQVLLNQDYPGEANSLGSRVRAAINLLKAIRCRTCNGSGRIGELGGGGHVCTDCSPLPRSHVPLSNRD